MKGAARLPFFCDNSTEESGLLGTGLNGWCSREPHHITNESGETSKKEPVNTGVIGYYLNGTTRARRHVHEENRLKENLMRR